MMKETPRLFGKESSVWTLCLMTEVLFETGETAHQIAAETLRVAMKENGVSWKRAKDWIQSPDEQYQLKKTARPLDSLGGRQTGDSRGLSR